MITSRFLLSKLFWCVKCILNIDLWQLLVCFHIAYINHSLFVRQWAALFLCHSYHCVPFNIISFDRHQVPFCTTSIKPVFDKYDLGLYDTGYSEHLCMTVPWSLVIWQCVVLTDISLPIVIIYWLNNILSSKFWVLTASVVV